MDLCTRTSKTNPLAKKDEWMIVSETMRLRNWIQGMSLQRREMEMRRNALALITALALTAGTSSSALAQQYRIKFAHPAPTSDPAHRTAQLFAEKIAERTSKKV